MVKCAAEPDGAAGLGGLLLDSFRLDVAEAPVAGGPALDADPLETCTSTSASSYSVYKQRIDSMFDETRSLLSGYGYGTGHAREAATSAGPPPPPPLPVRMEGAARAEAERRSRNGANAVQARIEKMFAEMSNGGMRHGAAGGGSGQRFSVDYLGSVPLADKVTTLQGLQGPLKDLYFGYRRHGDKEGDKPRGEHPAPWQPGFLEISGSGLRVHRGQGGDGQGQAQPGLGQLEQLNPFPRIAVWAAVQFVCRDGQLAGQPMECAFLPLIADPVQGGVDKNALFRELGPAEERVIRSMRSILRPTGDDDDDDDAGHRAPMFAVVMRGAGTTRQLECHGFVCSSSEDAVVMAANLYQALMASMRAASSAAPPEEVAAEAPAQGAEARGCPASGSAVGPRLLAGRIARMHHENGIGRLSIAGSVCGDGHATDPPSGLGSAAPSLSLSAESGCSSADRAPEDAASLAAKQQARKAKQVSRPKSSPPPQPKVPPPIPKRPPRKKKSSGSSTDGDDLIVLEDNSEPLRNSKAAASSLRGGYLPRAGDNRDGGACGNAWPAGSRRSSLIPASDVAPLASGAGGDILTKVAIPRSHSFLNANGPLTRYGRRAPTQRNGGTTGVDPAAGPGVNGVGVVGLGRAGGGGGGSPLGFNELFTEFRQQEGLDSLDDILGAIIDAEGMSFNDLKPIYKEFLLKLALTLTKDELYHRSKSIMRRQRKKQVGLGARRRGIAYTAVYIKRAVRRSINKLRPSKRSPLGKLLFSGGSGGQAKSKIAAKIVAPKKKSKKKMKPMPIPSSSISSYPSSNFRMNRRPSISVSQALDAACNVNVNVSINNNNRSSSNNKARLPRRRSSRRSSTRHHHQQQQALLPPLPPLPPPLATSTSEDSDFFTMIRCDSSRGGGRDRGTTLGTQGGRSGRSGKGGMNRSSSGYVSCSDCSYDSESCTCLSAERCYCSLSKYRPPPDALPAPCAPPCACDTDSCQGSDKCYCPRVRHHDSRRSARGPREPQGPTHQTRCGQRPRQRRGSSTPAVPVPALDATPPPSNIFEQLRQQGFAASDSSLSRAESPMTAWRKNESRMSHGPRAHRNSSAGGAAGHGGGAGAGERRKQRPSSSAGSMRSSRSLEFLQGPLLGHLQGNLQSLLTPPHRHPPSNLWDRERERAGKALKPPAKSKSSSKASLLDGFGSARSRCPSRMDMYRSSSRSCSYVAGPVLEPPALPVSGLRHGGHGSASGRPRHGSASGLHNSTSRASRASRTGSRAGSRPPSRAASIADSWVCEDEDGDEPVDEGVDEDMLLLGDTSSSRRSSRQARQQRKVLVVSARDPSGRVIYLGASASASASASVSGKAQSLHAQGVKAGQFFPRASLSHSGSSSRRQSRAKLPRHGQMPANKSSDAVDASEALSVKKSAEIAAMFTGVKVSQTTDIVARSTDVTDSRDSSTTTGDGEDFLYSSLDGHGPGQRGHARQAQGAYPSHSVGSNLENSLGYLP